MASKEWRDPETLKELYHDERLSLSEVGDELGCSTQTVKNNMDKHGIPTRSQHQAQVTDDVPIYVNNWGHEVVLTQYKGERHSVPIHRLAAVAWFGLDAITDKHIHHSNEIPWDTRESNIELVSPSEHMSIHHDTTEDEPWRDEATLKEAYEAHDQNKTQTADALGCSHETIRNWVRHFDITT